ncbi:hypothetical protein [Streptomyces sp. NBC_00572]|uniref:hypothetical protein n=1 Tax=Streptomyces sp. NBC_00572 TaxID=2903664 RepID=UPI00224FF8CD|nr:hypothetical protein [Streptomyces sp. NBC_00572]MCX4983465.1 hypothetical protein [Streptomyces sp. NBC_00572]
MPGKFIDEVLIYQCGTNSDGSAIMCSKIGYAKVPFFLTVPDTEGKPVGWQEGGNTEVHIPLALLTDAMKEFGITVDYDEAELERRLGPRPPESTEY